MVQPELRLVRYFVAVAEERNFTRAAERLNMAQPPLSSAIQQLESQLGVRLLDRTPREVRLTAAGELLLARGRELLATADEAFSAVRAVERDPTGLLKVGFSPAARYGPGPELLARWSARAPGVMVHTREDTTGAMVRDVMQGRLDLAVTFCLPESHGIASALLRDEPAIIHVRDDHRLVHREAVTIADLAGETLLVAGGKDSPGYTATVLGFCRVAGFEPATAPDPYPDLGLQAVREGLGVLVYVASAFPPQLEGSRLVPMEPSVTFPFHLVWREGARSVALDLLVRSALEGGPAI